MSDASSMQIGDDTSWANYAHTILELPDEPVLQLDLRAPLALEQQAELVRRGLRGQFAILTAANPRGRTVSESENEARLAALEASLTARGLTSQRADGVSLDGSHREEGVAICLSLESAMELACELEQSAFFWYDGDGFWLMPALVDATPRRLPAANSE